MAPRRLLSLSPTSKHIHPSYFSVRELSAVIPRVHCTCFAVVITQLTSSTSPQRFEIFHSSARTELVWIRTTADKPPNTVNSNDAHSPTLHFKCWLIAKAIVLGRQTRKFFCRPLFSCDEKRSGTMHKPLARRPGCTRRSCAPLLSGIRQRMPSGERTPKLVLKIT